MERHRGRKRTTRMLALALLALAVLLAPASPSRAAVPWPAAVPPPQVPGASIDPYLAAAIGRAGASGRVEAILTFDRRPSALDLAAVRAAGVAVAPFRVLPMIGVRGTGPQVNALLRQPGLRSAHLNRRLDTLLDESAPLIGADRAWNELGYTGRGVTVAVIDTGIDATHPDLPFGDKVVQNVKVAPDLFGLGTLLIEGVADTDTSSGHGTHVASTVAGSGAARGGRYRGVAPGARLVGVGVGDVLFVLSALEGFDYVLDHQATYGIRVISNSWGTSGEFDPDDPINVASRMAYEAGMVVAFAAGNAGPDANTLSPYCVAPWVLCVAAGEKDGRTLAEFSSRGVPGDPLNHPTITAPGVDIAAARATTGIVINAFFAVDLIDLGEDAVHYAVASGTSMATPHVSGTVALMLEANPALGPDEVKSLLGSTATTMPGYATHEVGTGYLNAYGAVQAAAALR